MLKKLAVFNFLSVIITLIVNYFAQTGQINGTTVGEVSARYNTLITPAGYAFSIWGLIYIGLLLFSVFMLYQAFTNGKHTRFINNTSFWFIIANVGNCLWLFAWLYGYGGMSVILIFLILLTLIRVIINNKMELWDAPIQVIAFYWWPICLYAGWISIAAIVNIAAFLTEVNWEGAFLTEVQWALTIIAIATILNIIIIYTRNMREFAAVGVWALIGIAVKQFQNEELVAYTAIAGAILIFMNIAYHGFINRKTNPMYKLANGQKL